MKKLPHPDEIDLLDDDLLEMPFNKEPIHPDEISKKDRSGVEKLLTALENMDEAPLAPYENPATLPILEYWNRIWCVNPGDRLWTDADKKWWSRVPQQVDIMDPLPIRAEPPEAFVKLFERVNDLVNSPSPENRAATKEILKEFGALREVFPLVGSRWKAKTGKRIIKVLELIEGTEEKPPQVKVLNELEGKVYCLGLDKDTSPHGYVRVE